MLAAFLALAAATAAARTGAAPSAARAPREADGNALHVLNEGAVPRSDAGAPADGGAARSFARALADGLPSV
jgi:hypothetical protein